MHPRPGTHSCLPQVAVFLKGEGSGVGGLGKEGRSTGQRLTWAICLLAVLRRAEAQEPEELYVPALRLDGEVTWTPRDTGGPLRAEST